MRKSNIFLASTVALALGVVPAAQAQSSSDTEMTEAVVAGTGVAAGGALVGFAIGGPIGAVVGGLAGASIGAGATMVDNVAMVDAGAEFGIPASTVSYVRTHPAPELDVSFDLAMGDPVPAGSQLVVIPGQPEYSYAYHDGRPVIIDNQSYTVVWIG
jgi:hypothetical protein